MLTQFKTRAKDIFQGGIFQNNVLYVEPLSDPVELLLISEMLRQSNNVASSNASDLKNNLHNKN